MLVATSLGWALAYRSLWYEAARAEGRLEQAEAYITPTTCPFAFVPRMTPVTGDQNK